NEIRARFGFMPDKFIPGELHSLPLESDSFDDSVIGAINKRRKSHITVLKEIRPESVHEWFLIWPATMRTEITNHHCNRRLFPSYEIFMSHESVMIGAGVKVDWKLNRKLFYTAFKSVLQKTMWLPH